MRAILAERLGGAEVMRAGELGMPEPAPDEVLIRVLAAGVGPWACSASSLPGAARAARDGATIATPVPAGLPDAHRVDWQLYEGRSSGSRLVRMAPRFDDGTLTVHVAAMY